MMMQPKQELKDSRGRDERERNPPQELEGEAQGDAPRAPAPEDVGCEFSVLLHLGLM